MDGMNTFALIATIASVTMVVSEIVAKIKKKKIQPSQPAKVFVIGNMIPFTNLNIVFALSIMVRVIIDLIWNSTYGLPKIAIQITFMLMCLLLCNDDAKTYAKRRFAAWRGVNVGPGNNKVKPGPREDLQMELDQNKHEETDITETGNTQGMAEEENI